MMSDADDNKFNRLDDQAIRKPGEDYFGYDGFAQSIAKTIFELDSSRGSTVIGIHGPWGSGKSSVINLVQHYLEEVWSKEVRENPEASVLLRNKTKEEIEELYSTEEGTKESSEKEPSQKLKIVEFRPWWFRGEEAVLLAFLQELYATLDTNIKDSVKEFVKKAKAVLKALLKPYKVPAPVQTKSAKALLKLIVHKVVALNPKAGSQDFVDTLFDSEKSFDELFKRLSQALKEQKKRYLIIIDDIDRLMPEEALLVFRLVKTLGSLPNLIYLLGFDRELVQKNIADKYPAEVDHFLEKIIQASFDLPIPSQDDLYEQATRQIEEVCGPFKYSESSHWEDGDYPDDDHGYGGAYQELAEKLIRFYFKTPRDLKRFSNALRVTYLPIKEEVYLLDFLVIELFRLFEPELYRVIQSSKKELSRLGLPSGLGWDGKMAENLRGNFLNSILEDDDEKKKCIKKALSWLFPQLNGRVPEIDDMRREGRRRICSTNHFDTYFHLSLGKGVFPEQEISDFISLCSNKEEFQKHLQEMANDGNEKHKVGKLLLEVGRRPHKVQGKNFASLIEGVFEIADELQEKIRDGLLYLRIYIMVWFLLLEGKTRMSMGQRDAFILKHCKQAPLIFLAYFTVYIQRDYDEKRTKDFKEHIISPNALKELKTYARQTIREASKGNTLLKHPMLSSKMPYFNLFSLLYCWKNLAPKNGAEEVQAWTKGRMEDPSALIKFAGIFTNEILRAYDGPRQKPNNAENLAELIDLEVFYNKLRDLQSSEEFKKFGLEEQKDVQNYLEAWKKYQEVFHKLREEDRIVPKVIAPNELTS